MRMTHTPVSVYACEATPIGADETAGELRSRLVGLGTRLLVDTLPKVPGSDPAEQAGEPVYAEKLSVEEFRLDPGRPATELARLVRAGNPRPGAWTIVGGHRVKVLRAHAGQPGAATAGPATLDRSGRLATADGVLVLDEVQPEGRRAMAADAWLRGLHGDAWTLGS
jgi:methionyl-tRNA formyltransferase